MAPEKYAWRSGVLSRGKSLIRELRAAGISVKEKVEAVDVVWIEFDTELTTEKLRRSCGILSTQKGVHLATNPNLVCSVSFGFVPDYGSICDIIRNATEKEPYYIGKPERGRYGSHWRPPIYGYSNKVQCRCFSACVLIGGANCPIH